MNNIKGFYLIESNNNYKGNISNIAIVYVIIIYKRIKIDKFKRIFGNECYNNIYFKYLLSYSYINNW